MNPLMQTDSYKLSHFNQYPDDTEGVFSYFESRVGAEWNATVFFGLSYLLRRYLSGRRVDMASIATTEDFVGRHLGNPELFNRAGWEHIVKEHEGKLPLRIRAVREGSIIPVSNVMMTVENTDPKCYWLTNYVESLLTHIWYPCTVATLSRAVRDDMANFMRDTADSMDPLKFMLHDFGYRGVSSEESAQLGGAAHLINFVGSDTIAGIEFAHDWYQGDYDDLAFSVPATEHSVMTSQGREGEHELVDDLLRKHPTGILSVVADSYDIYSFVEHVCSRANEILSRDGVFVVRPDSCTNDDKTPEDLSLTILNRLWQTFDGEVNSKGYRVLDGHIRVLWGDGIDPEGIHRILNRMKDQGWAAHNMIFGMGGGLLQKINRDTQRFAFKASAIKRSGQWMNINKEPLDMSKASKKGRLSLVCENGEYYTTSEEVPPGLDLLQDVFINGDVLEYPTFAEIRAYADASPISADYSREKGVQ